MALLVGDGALFAALIFGVAFLHVVAPGLPPPPALAATSLAQGLLAALAAGLLVAGLGARMTQARHRAARSIAAWAVLGLAGNVAALAALAGLAGWVMDDPAAHARDALRGVLAGYVGLHVLICTLMAAFVLDQLRRGEGAATGAPAGWRLWQDFATATGLISIAVVLGTAAIA